MIIKIEEINRFFDTFGKSDMPHIVREMTLEGRQLQRGNLGTTTIQRNWILESNPELARKVNPDRNCEVPVMREFDTPRYHTYHPITGKYLGVYEVNPNAA